MKCDKHLGILPQPYRPFKVFTKIVYLKCWHFYKEFFIIWIEDFIDINTFYTHQSSLN